MQKIILCALLLFSSSCTIVRKAPVNKFGLELFEEVKEDQSFVQNKLLTIKFITCRKRWFSDGGKSKEYLKGEFKKKYGEKLYGVSNMEIEQTHVTDSSIFIPNEICHQVTGNPVTKTKLKINKNELWELINSEHHIH